MTGTLKTYKRPTEPGTYAEHVTPEGFVRYYPVTDAQVAQRHALADALGFTRRTPCSFCTAGYPTGCPGEGTAAEKRRQSIAYCGIGGRSCRGGIGLLRMQYQGGKSRIARPIAETIRRMYPTCTEIWEPFCGGGAVTLALSKAGFKVHASDIHHDLIMMWRAVMAGDEGVYADVTEEEYNALKNAPSSARRGFVGFGASFGGSWFGGYGRRESCGAQEDLEEIKGWHCPTCGGGKHETHDPIDRLIAEYMTPAPQAQAKLDEKTIKAQMLAWFRTEPSEYTSEVYLPAN